MNDMDLSGNFFVEWSADNDFRAGCIFHIRKNESGGSLSKPVARFFITGARIPAEGYFPHQRLDCFVSDTQLAPQPDQLARDLFRILRERGLIGEPVWLSWHLAEEQDGAAVGEVFDFD